LPLALPHAPEYGADSFAVGPSNRAAFAAIVRWPDWPAPVVVLSGPPGSGKTHLAHIWAERAGASVLTAGDLDRAGHGLADPGPALAVEDIDPACVPERSVFHLINRCKEAGTGLLLTSQAPAASWAVALPDLRSRLRMAAPAMLEQPDEELLRLVLVKLFADRQLTIAKPVVDYLLARMERSLGAAVRVVESLDRAALAEGRRITTPLAAAVLPGLDLRDDKFPDR
jgi:chromosomal replication initiation ATPase DnaA